MIKIPQSRARVQGVVRFALLLGLICSATFLVMGFPHLTSEVGRPLRPEPSSRVVGTSTLSNVLNTINPPSRISATAGGFAMLYQYNGVDEKQLGFSISVRVLRWSKFVGAKSWLKHQACLVSFDTNGIMRGWGEEHGRNLLGKGGRKSWSPSPVWWIPLRCADLLPSMNGQKAGWSRSPNCSIRPKVSITARWVWSRTWHPRPWGSALSR